MVVSPTVSTILESIPGFAADGDGEKMEYNFGIQKIGNAPNLVVQNLRSFSVQNSYVLRKSLVFQKRTLEI